MRSLQIALILLISAAFMLHQSDSAAASGAKHSAKGHKARSQSKGKKRASNPNAGNVWERIRLGIRIPRPSQASAGFDQIKVPTGKNSSLSSSQTIKSVESYVAQTDESTRLSTVIIPKKLLRGESQLPEKLRVRQVLIPNGSQHKTGISSDERYTRLGRLKLGSKGEQPAGKVSSVKQDSLFKSPSVQRIRTQLGLHPELFKHGEVVENASITRKIKSQGQVVIRGCSDLYKKEVTSSAQKGILPENYSQMAEQCRLKQNENYERVNKHVVAYSQRSGYLYGVSERARPYLYHIVDALSKYNLPLDLALLPIVESAYQPTALSNKDAAGIWQFIPSTGKEYGLQQTSDYDDRLNITASTNAAIRFLSGLNAHFKGDWLLALAAYNCGQGAVDAAISRNQAEGLDTDFWSLDLPAETQDYVPRLLALSSIFENPGNYGLKLRSVRNEPYFIKVNIDRETDINSLAKKDLNTIAKLAEFDPDQFGLLNAAYIKSTLPENNRPFTLLMPISNANLLHQSLAFMAQSNNGKMNAALPLLPELTLAQQAIEQKAQMPLLSVQLNDDKKWFLSTGQLAELGVVRQSAGNEIKPAKLPNEDYWAVHYLDKGESLKAVAEFHGITEDLLRIANKLKRRQSISLGQRLLVPLKQIASESFNKASTSILFKGV